MIRLEKGIISNSQLKHLITGFVTGGIVTVPYATQLVKHDNWLAILIGFFLSLPMVLVYIHLAQRFPQHNLVQILHIVYGPLMGKLLSASMIFFVFNLLIFNLDFVGDFTLTYLLPETPMWVVLFMFTFVCAWAIRLGLEVIARVNPIFVMITLCVISLTILLLIREMELTYILPLFEAPPYNFVQAVHLIVSIPFLEVVIFLFFTPYTQDARQIKRPILIGYGFGALFLLLPILRNTAVLGPIIVILASPSYESIRLIDIGDFLTRLEVLYSVALIILLFIKSCLFYYATTLGIAQLFRMRSYLPLVIPLGILSISYTLTVHEPSLVNVDTILKVWPFICFPFQIALPLLTLLLAKMRNLPKQAPKEV